MKKRLLTVGDSFTYGDELTDQYDAWPYKLADLLDYHVVNLGQSGCSNTSIVRRALYEIANSTDPYDLVVIGWTSPGRIEWKDHTGVAYDMWPGFQVRGKFFEMHPWREDLLHYINSYHDVEYLFERYVIDVLTMQSYLKVKNIPYVMLNVCQNDYYRLSSPPDGPVTREIDKKMFFGWNEFGIIELTKKFPKGPKMHPLKEGHREIANQIYKFINEIINNW